MSRRTLTLVVAGLLVAAGCIGTKPGPPRPTQLCGLGFGTASDYQADFYSLGHADTGWITADGFVPISLPPPDGRTLWWMSDTMTGSTNPIPDNSVSNPGNVHNSLVQQGGGCLTPTFGNPDLIPAPSPRWYWPGSTVVEGNTMLVFAYVVGPNDQIAPPFNFTVFGTAVVRYHLPELGFQGVTNLPTQNTSPFGGGSVPWGIRSVDVDGTVYLYGTTKRSIYGPADVWVAKALFADVANPNAWEYFTDLPAPAPAWSTNFTLAQPMSFPGCPTPPVAPTDDCAPLGQFSVARYGDKYLGSAVSDVLDTRVRAWIADSPEGPWTYLGVVATAARQNTNQMVYDARMADLTGAGWTVVYNVNDPNRQHQEQNFTLYRGQFAHPAASVFPPP